MLRASLTLAALLATAAALHPAAAEDSDDQNCRTVHWHADGTVSEGGSAGEGTSRGDGSASASASGRGGSSASSSVHASSRAGGSGSASASSSSRTDPNGRVTTVTRDDRGCTITIDDRNLRPE